MPVIDFAKSSEGEFVWEDFQCKRSPCKLFIVVITVQVHTCVFLDTETGQYLREGTMKGLASYLPYCLLHFSVDRVTHKYFSRPRKKGREQLGQHQKPFSAKCDFARLVLECLLHRLPSTGKGSSSHLYVKATCYRDKPNYLQFLTGMPCSCELVKFFHYYKIMGTN